MKYLNLGLIKQLSKSGKYKITTYRGLLQLKNKIIHIKLPLFVWSSRLSQESIDTILAKLGRNL